MKSKGGAKEKAFTFNRCGIAKPASAFIALNPDTNSPFEHIDRWLLDDANWRTEASISYALKVADWLIGKLGDLGETHPELIRPLASRMAYWPVTVNAKGTVAKKDRWLIDWIGLGSDPEALIRSGRIARHMTIAKKWALQLMRIIQGVRDGMEMPPKTKYRMFPRPTKIHAPSKILKVEDALSALAGHWMLSIQITVPIIDRCASLPRITAEISTVDAWWNVGRDLLLLNTDDAPEANQELRKVGLSRRTHDSSVKPSSEASNIRSKIFTDLKEEFGRIARKVCGQQAKADS